MSARIEIQECVISGPAADHVLHGDLYLPARDQTEISSAVVLVYGGSWRSSDKSQQRVYGLALAKAGIVCLATDYRWSTDAKWPAQIDDVRTAVRWLRAHTADFNIDPERIAVSGNSSGGHLALMVATVDEGSGIASMKNAAWGEYSSAVSAVCAFYPPTILYGLDDESNDDSVITLLGADATKDDYASASPISFVSRNFPPVLLLSGSDDERVPIAHTYELHKALENAGNTVELHVFAGQGHAFDADRDLARVSATIMVDFFRRYV